MKANYGYQDGSGEYYITIDTDKCNGCGDCIRACSKNLFIMITDDYDEMKPMVKEEVSNQLAELCETSLCGYKCQNVCSEKAISHSW